jgi:hypothetical protein
MLADITLNPVSVLVVLAIIVCIVWLVRNL